MLINPTEAPGDGQIATPGTVGRRKETHDLIDGFGRRIDYVRLSITDRCDLRCRYCMGEAMRFVANDALLTFDEIERLVDLFMARGVRRVRLTGGEPLVRRGVLDLVMRLGCRVGQGLDELTMTTNGTHLAGVADALAAAGIRRINVSLDTRDAAKFAHITRRGQVGPVLDGIAAAKAAGLTIKINMVAMRGFNEDEIEPMMRWCAGEGFGLTLIETMPLGAIEAQRQGAYLPLDAVRRELTQRFTLIPSLDRTGGPARYYEVVELGLTLGLITPLTNNFCAGCNRVRVTATGAVFGCLGHNQKVELRDMLRDGNAASLNQALDKLLSGKPQRHDFDIAALAPAVDRHMSVTGG